MSKAGAADRRRRGGELSQALTFALSFIIQELPAQETAEDLKGRVLVVVG